MQFGSVAFFKVLIKTVLCIVFFVPLVLCVVFTKFINCRIQIVQCVLKCYALKFSKLVFNFFNSLVLV